MIIGVAFFFTVLIIGTAFCEKTKIGDRISKWSLKTFYDFTAEELED